MLSKALSHYPQFRFRDGQKKLWNPILKKTYVNLPEERVRLSLIEYLTLEAGFSQHRISFESPVRLEGDKTSSRTDIIGYDQDFKPLLLAECKAPEIKLDDKAAIQVARYNQKVGAPFVLVSNGILDFWFEVAGEKIQGMKEIPSQFSPKNIIERKLSYWQNRGFIGEKLKPEVRDFAYRVCNELFADPLQPVKYLSFEDPNPEIVLGNYYRIFGLDEKVKIALSLTANPFGGTRLNAVLNQNGANTVFSTSSLDLIAEDEGINTEIHSAKGMYEADFVREINFSFEQNIAGIVGDIGNLLLQHS